MSEDYRAAAATTDVSETGMRVWLEQHKGGLLVSYSIVGGIWSLYVLLNVDSPIMLGLQMFTLGSVVTIALQQWRNRE